MKKPINFNAFNAKAVNKVSVKDNVSVKVKDNVVSSPQVIDSRLKALSHSSCISLHTCPRKYQLNKTGLDSPRETSVTLSYGTSFGAAVQKILTTGSYEEGILEAFLTWDQDLEEFDNSNKSLFEMIAGLEGLQSFAEDNDLGEYEVAIFNGVPACEYSFAIDLGDGFYYRGFVDLVLKHKISNVYTVLEVKHTGMSFCMESSYGKQAQALSYTVVLDFLTRGMNAKADYKVMYLVYMTRTNKYEEFLFPKSYTQRAKFIRNLLLDKKAVQLYSSLGDYPQHGESCTSWGRPCKHYETCDMSDKHLVSKVETRDVLELDKGTRLNTTYDIVVSIKDLIMDQRND